MLPNKKRIKTKYKKDQLTGIDLSSTKPQAGAYTLGNCEVSVPSRTVVIKTGFFFLLLFVFLFCTSIVYKQMALIGHYRRFLCS